MAGNKATTSVVLVCALVLFGGLAAATTSKRSGANSMAVVGGADGSDVSVSRSIMPVVEERNAAPVDLIEKTVYRDKQFGGELVAVTGERLINNVAASAGDVTPGDRDLAISPG